MKAERSKSQAKREEQLTDRKRARARSKGMRDAHFDLSALKAATEDVKTNS